MPNTSNFSLPFPQASDTVDVPRDVSALAQAVDTELVNRRNESVRIFASTTARDTAIPSPAAGQVCYVNSNDANEGLYTYSGSAWLKGPGWNAPWGTVVETGASNSTGFTAGNALTVLSVTVTIIPNRIYRISGKIAVQPSGAAGPAALYIGGTNVPTETLAYKSAAIGTNLIESLSGFVIATAAGFSVTSGTGTSRTIDLRFRCGANGSLSTNPDNYIGAGSFPQRLVIEDIGPAGAPV